MPENLLEEEPDQTDYLKEMKWKTALRLIPFSIMAIIMVYTWFVFLFGKYAPEARHIIALVLVIANLLLYFFRLRNGLLLTGAILILAAFNGLAFFPDIETTRLFINFSSDLRLSTPDIQGSSLLLFILYFAINGSLVINVCLDFKERKSRVK